MNFENFWDSLGNHILMDDLKLFKKDLEIIILNNSKSLWYEKIHLGKIYVKS
jgi:hypothetical protein